jgi:hypothetical protein
MPENTHGSCGGDVAYALSFRGNVHERIQIGGKYGIKYIKGNE